MHDAVIRSSISIDEFPIFLEITWVEANRRRDPDNIAYSIKFILDGFVAASIMPSDSWKYIKGWVSKFAVYPAIDNPIKIPAKYGIIVRILT